MRRQPLRRLTLPTFVVLAGWLAGGASEAQVVQLPSFSRFSVNTTVWAPDRGSVNLGGVSRGYQSSTRNGASRAISDFGSLSGVELHARIIDLEEMDRQVLAEAARRSGGRLAEEAPRSAAGAAATRLPSESDRAGAMSLAELRARAAAARSQERPAWQAKLADAEALWLRGEQERSRQAFRAAYALADAAEKRVIVERFLRLKQQQTLANLDDRR